MVSISVGEAIRVKKKINGNIFENHVVNYLPINWELAGLTIGVFLWLFLGGLFQSVSKPNFEKNNKCKAGRKNRDDLAETTVIHDVSADSGGGRQT